MQFKKRLEFCLNLYNSTTKALQYPEELAVQYEIGDKSEVSPEELAKMIEGDGDFDFWVQCNWNLYFVKLEYLVSKFAYLKIC